MAKKTKKAKKKQQKRYYGLTVLKEGQKFAWLSVQNKNGWSLGFALNNRTVWLRNIRFKNAKEVSRAMEKGSLVFIELKHPELVK